MSSFTTNRPANPVGESVPADDQIGSFVGDIDAGRRQLDSYGIQVKISTLYSLALTLNRALFTSADPSRQLQGELVPLIIALSHAAHPSSPRPDHEYYQMAPDLEQSGFILQELGKFKIDCDIQAQSKTGETPQSNLQEQSNQIKLALAFNTQNLNRWNVESIRTAQNELEKPLRNFADSIAWDKLNSSSSVVWNPALLTGDRNAWKQLRAELRAAGVSDEGYLVNMEFIVSHFKDTDFRGNIPDIYIVRYASMDINDFTKIEPPNFRFSISSAPNGSNDSAMED